MSSLPSLALPRFHVNELPSTSKNLGRALRSEVEEETFAIPVEEDPAEQEPEHEAQAAPAPPPEALLPEIDTGTILKSLEDAKAALERTALLHSRQLVSDFILAAFPSLSASFLAEEVLQTTNAMTPPEIERLVLTVPNAYEASFQTAIQASPEMRERCDVQTQTDGDEILIDVDWQTGGLHFDLQQFLESSMARLSGPTQIQEGHNV